MALDVGVEKAGFRVIIAGGGVAGLVLANALERGGVDYVLLERRSEIAPVSGASICMVPNGCRILDQLGFYEPFFDSTVPVNEVFDRDKNGNPLAPGSDFAQLQTARTGYQLSFGDRRALLQIMYDGLKDKSKVLLNKKLIEVDNSDDGVTVTCEDGTLYTGDILLGADGVYSKTREAVWDLAAKQRPDAVRKDRQSLTAEYQCLFGTCMMADGMKIGDGEYGYDHGRSSLVVCCKEGRTYYFIFQKMDKTYHATGFPRYSKEETEEFAKAHFDVKIRPNVTFEALWKNTIAANLVVLEEGTFDIWTHGRIALVGDSIHKMTPNIGYGGNTAIESAAALASAIKDLVDEADGGHPTKSRIKARFLAYQKARKERTNQMVAVSADVTRIQAMQKVQIMKYLIPYLGDTLADLQSEMVVGATTIQFLPIPQRSVKNVNMPYNPAQGDGMKESKLKRLALALPFVFLCISAAKLMAPDPLIPWATSILETKKLPWNDTPLPTTFYHLKWLDDALAPLIIFFSPVLLDINNISHQALLLLSDYSLILAIWLIESARRANTFTPAQLPLLFTLSSQFIGVGVISPLYYLLHYVLTPIEKFKAADMRLTRVAYTKAILPAVILTYQVPLYFSFFAPSFADRVSWCFLWQLYPLWLSPTASYVLSRFFADTTKRDRVHDVTRDLRAIRTTVGLLSAQSALLWVYTLFKANVSFRTIAAEILPPLQSPQDAADLVTFAGEFLRFDQAFLFGNTLLWLAYLFWDIKHAGMLSTGWGKILGYAAVSLVVLGPSATAGLGFLWREEILATRRHSAAMTEEKARERNRELGYEWDESGASVKIGGREKGKGGKK
ncbi:hypothetical protein QBC34DRAFT_441370 [Podospora aff. communis PSN243]|uniref:FAD-binding domain-containing protein n=1 Tax=Podospora aff. communis PSN243 TaxID=3040156 RepID=A0AAV9GCU8_9PEZI|nr:hypothetical protein QBC34DRAFT_441370 [Podospora aff. communis PSN243]